MLFWQDAHSLLMKMVKHNSMVKDQDVQIIIQTSQSFGNPKLVHVEITITVLEFLSKGIQVLFQWDSPSFLLNCSVSHLKSCSIPSVKYKIFNGWHYWDMYSQRINKINSGQQWWNFIYLFGFAKNDSTNNIQQHYSSGLLLNNVIHPSVRLSIYLSICPSIIFFLVFIRLVVNNNNKWLTWKTNAFWECSEMMRY